MVKLKNNNKGFYCYIIKDFIVTIKEHNVQKRYNKNYKLQTIQKCEDADKIFA